MLHRNITIFCIFSCFVVIFTLCLFSKLIWWHAKILILNVRLFINLFIVCLFNLWIMTLSHWYVLKSHMLFQCVLFHYELAFHWVIFVLFEKHQCVYFPPFFSSWATERILPLWVVSSLLRLSSANTPAIKFLKKNFANVCLRGS